jgi:hypothetical protein
MKPALTFFLVCVLALLFSCDMTTVRRSDTWSAPPSNQFPQLTIYLADSNAAINYNGNAEKEFGKGNRDTLIWQFFKSQLIKEIARKTVFKEAVYDRPDNQLPGSTEMLKVSGMGDLLFKIPRKGSRYSFPNSSPDFVIFLNDIIISSSKNPTWRARFMFYDNVSGQLISCGYIDVEGNNAFSASKDRWLPVSDEFVAKLFKATPFLEGL